MCCFWEVGEGDCRPMHLIEPGLQRPVVAGAAGAPYHRRLGWKLQLPPVLSRLTARPPPHC